MTAGGPAFPPGPRRERCAPSTPVCAQAPASAWAARAGVPAGAARASVPPLSTEGPGPVLPTTSGTALHGTRGQTGRRPPPAPVPTRKHKVEVSAGAGVEGSRAPASARSAPEQQARRALPPCRRLCRVLPRDPRLGAPPLGLSVAAPGTPARQSLLTPVPTPLPQHLPPELRPPRPGPSVTALAPGAGRAGSLGQASDRSRPPLHPQSAAQLSQCASPPHCLQWELRPPGRVCERTPDCVGAGNPICGSPTQSLLPAGRGCKPLESRGIGGGLPTLPALGRSWGAGLPDREDSEQEAAQDPHPPTPPHARASRHPRASLSGRVGHAHRGAHPPPTPPPAGRAEDFRGACQDESCI